MYVYLTKQLITHNERTAKYKISLEGHDSRSEFAVCAPKIVLSAMFSSN